MQKPLFASSRKKIKDITVKIRRSRAAAYIIILMIQAGTRSNSGWSRRPTLLFFKRGVFRKDIEECLIDKKKKWKDLNS